MDETRVLVIAAHPDDEVLGCGGTVALHARRGDRVHVIVACEGESLRYRKGESGPDLPRYTREANAILGVERVVELGFPDQRLDILNLVDVITPLEQVVAEFQPTVVYAQHGGDVNRDHHLLFEAILVATRPIETCIEAVLAFETASSTEWAHPRQFAPDTWIDISEVLDQKLDAFSRYESEVREYPHPRSIEGLRNRARAWGNQCCLDAAEVFQTVRRIRRSGQTLP